MDNFWYNNCYCFDYRKKGEIMAKGYGFEFKIQEIVSLLLILIAFVLVLPYVLKQLLKNTYSAALEPVAAIIAPVQNAGAWTGNNVLTPVIRSIGQAVAPEGWKITVGDTTYGDFAKAPSQAAYGQALQDAKTDLYYGRGTRDIGGFLYVDKIIEGRNTRFILQADGKTVAPVSMPP